jgi:hypothetical protein
MAKHNHIVICRLSIIPFRTFAPILSISFIDKLASSLSWLWLEILSNLSPIIMTLDWLNRDES